VRIERSLVVAKPQGTILYDTLFVNGCGYELNLLSFCCKLEYGKANERTAKKIYIVSPKSYFANWKLLLLEKIRSGIESIFQKKVNLLGCK